MTEETNVARLVEHAGMVAMVNGVWIVVTAVGSYIVSLTGFLDVAIHDDFTIDSNSDVVALHSDFLLAPLAKRFVLDTLGGNDTIDGAMYLILAQTSIDRVIVVKNLTLAHAIVGYS